MEDPKSRLQDYGIDINRLPQGEKEKLWFLYERSRQAPKASLIWPVILTVISLQLVTLGIFQISLWPTVGGILIGIWALLSIQKQIKRDETEALRKHDYEKALYRLVPEEDQDEEF